MQMLQENAHLLHSYCFCATAAAAVAKRASPQLEKRSSCMMHGKMSPFIIPRLIKWQSDDFISHQD